MKPQELIQTARAIPKVTLLENTTAGLATVQGNDTADLIHELADLAERGVNAAAEAYQVVGALIVAPRLRWRREDHG